MSLLVVAITATSASNCSWTEKEESTFKAVLVWPGARSRRREVRDSSIAFWERVPPQSFSVRSLNAGQGTTGTHLVYNVSCRAGLPSVHYRSKCHLLDDDESERPSRELVTFYNTLANCVEPREGEERPPRKHCLARGASTRVRSMLRDVLTSGVVSLVDTPYTYLVDEIVTAIPDVQVVFTQRSPMAWADRRHDRFGGRDIICKSSVVEVNRDASYFDLIACLESAAELNLEIGEAFTNVKQVFFQERNGHERLAAMFAAHTRYILDSIARRTSFAPACVWDDDVPAQVRRLDGFLRQAILYAGDYHQHSPLRNYDDDVKAKAGDVVDLTPHASRAASSLLAQPARRSIDFFLVGSSGADRERRWFLPFIEEHFTQRSYLEFTDKENLRHWTPLGRFDRSLDRIDDSQNARERYYQLMASSNFSLCGGPSSTCFRDSLVTKTIPIVASYIFRSLEEARLDYKFYTIQDKDFVVREDWTHHNYETFIRYHTKTDV
ncbi:hypothetical protein CTAYLR_009554 [Chrysophaeum taylorii]|uniref:Exostosin GT47 domain-containing protein n=1 Tax=Chrysophaeum taylorii TaxID=2483200 RepID=A0AAD7UJE5_9STRA|nr:hypothetical protein CTAYLR_009554 [Chrysophaeum taylorii]